MTNIHVYGSHNASFVLEKDGEILEIIELERLFSKKNLGLSQYLPIGDPPVNTVFVLNYIKHKFNISEFDTCFFMNTDFIHNNKVLYDVKNLIPAKNYQGYNHHESHAAGVFYQSSFKKALIFSFDGGGNDGKFNIYLADREKGLNLLEKVKNPRLNTDYIYYDLGFPYMVFGQYLKDINFESDINVGNLVYPGKLMGLASYGVVNNEWLPYFINFYESDPNGSTYQVGLTELGDKLNTHFDINNRIEGQIAYDIAATSQKAFEECFLKIAIPYMEKYKKLPICITGGCGLNILLNTRLVKEFKKDVFVGPNPNDCGLAVGNVLNVLKPKNPVDLTYKGIDLLDRNKLMYYAVSHPHTILSGEEIFNFEDFKSIFFNHDFNLVVNDLIEGKIIGLVQGTSEHGPRALGNRSILANPTFLDMKDVLNKKVKNREWYRPFAPIVRLEDVSKYFEWDKESKWMSFCPLVKEEYQKSLPSITHVDGTARVQTVTKEQNSLLYWLLTELHAKTGVGVLLNTSFNVAGKPIVSSLKDAFTVYENTDLDCLLIENVYIRKNGF